MLDNVGIACWYLMFASPFIIFPWVWKVVDGSKATKIAVGLFWSAVCFVLLGIVSLAIFFRNGLGPC